MISFTTNQRRIVRWDGSNWMEEVASASGIEISTDGFVQLSGSTVQDALGNVDTLFQGLDYSAASGVILIDEVTSVTGVSGSSLGNLATVAMPSGNNSAVRFSFTIPAQPTAVAPKMRFLVAPRAAVSGNVQFDLEYNVFDQNDSLSASAFTYSGSDISSYLVGDQDKLKLVSIEIPLSRFSGVAAPIIFSAKLTRNTSVGSNYAGDLDLVSVNADNIPGGVAGNSAGYLGGNLLVDGNLTVSGTTYLQGGSVPASGTAAGTQGAVVISSNYVYFCTATNTWKRVSIGGGF